MIQAQMKAQNYKS